MPRYVTKLTDTRTHWGSFEYEETGSTARDVIVTDDEPKFSGILNASGEKLYRLEDRVPLGFHKRTT